MSSKTPPKLPGRSHVAQRASRVSASRAFGELADSGRLRIVSLDAIVPNPNQPRRRFDADALQGLADSIAERGILQPPVVRDMGETYELVAGERRCRAARLAGLTQIEVLVGDRDDGESLKDAVMENAAREDLSPVEAAHAYATLIEDLGITREAVGRLIGQSRVSISNHLRLLDLPDAALDLIDSGQLTFAHGRVLLSCKDHGMRLRLARRAVAKHWSTRQLEAAVRDVEKPTAARPCAPADGEAFAARYTDAVSTATGWRVSTRVTADGAVRVTFDLADPDQAQELAAKLGAPREAIEEPELAARAGDSRAG